MPLEAGTYISDLVQTNPSGTDTRRQGDDHLRLLKKVLQSTFPALNGAVTATPEQLNLTTDPTNFLPSGIIVLWSGLIADIPDGWAFCDGTQGTLDLRGVGIIGAIQDAGGTFPVGGSGGSADIEYPTETEEHTLVVNEIPSHQHQGGDCNIAGTKYGASTAGPTGSRRQGSTTSNDASALTSFVGGGQGHSHGITFDGTGKNLAPYKVYGYIQKL